MAADHIPDGRELPACPCCNWPAPMLETDGSCFAGQHYPSEPGQTGYKFRCDKCGLQTCWWHSEQQARDAWSTRSAALPKQSEPSREELDAKTLAESIIDATFMCPPMSYKLKRGKRDLMVTILADKIQTASKPADDGEREAVFKRCAEIADKFSYEAGQAILAEGTAMTQHPPVRPDGDAL